MTNEQALQALKTAAEMAALPAKDHMICQKAYDILKEIIAQHENAGEKAK